MRIFIQGFIQVFLVSLNTVFIARSNYCMMFLTSFCLSYVWTMNVKKISISLFYDRFLYSIGAASGCLFGVFLCNYLFY